MLAFAHRSGVLASGPYQTQPIVADIPAMGVEQFFLERCESLVVELELNFERAVRQPAAAAQQVDHLIEHHVEIHVRPRADKVKPRRVLHGLYEKAAEALLL